MLVKSTPAVVISTLDHGESDLIVTCYTPEHGKLTGIARGAKRSRKRFVNKLELFSLLDLQYREGKKSSLVYLDQAELSNSFPSLRQDFRRYVAASLLSELTLHWTRENDGDAELFELLTWALTNLDEGREAGRIIIFFLSRLFAILGFQPQLDGCVLCGSLALQRGPYRFSTSRCGLICAQCRDLNTHSQLPVSLNTAKLLHRAMELPIDKLERLHFSPASCREALNLLERYGYHLLQREIHSWRLLPQAMVAG